MHKLEVTRGYGLLERFLSKQRAKIADGLIPSAYRKGRILDIGCGIYPLALLNIEFSEKFGLDKTMNENTNGQFNNQKIAIINYNIEKEDVIPFDNNYFNVVTMLAVFEHIEPKKIVKITKEIHRILTPGGIYIMTTPAIWSDRLLRIMAKMKLVSSIEIEEHKCAYNHSMISNIICESGFIEKNIRLGYFEMFMNIWATAVK